MAYLPESTIQLGCNPLFSFLILLNSIESCFCFFSYALPIAVSIYYFRSKILFLFALDINPEESMIVCQIVEGLVAPRIPRYGNIY